MMTNWLPPKRAAQHLRGLNPETAIGESTIRTLIRSGFPHILIGKRFLINVDSFDVDLKSFRDRQS